jgi:hypothetical protein
MNYSQANLGQMKNEHTLDQSTLLDFWINNILESLPTKSNGQRLGEPVLPITNLTSKASACSAGQ